MEMRYRPSSLGERVENHALPSGRRIGVITLPGDFNYGNKLQLYAAITIWRKLGFDPVYLSHKKPARPYAHPRQLVRDALGKTQVGGNDLRTPGRVKAFDRFNELIPTIHVEKISDIDPASFAYLSVGSDQVWNPPVEPVDSIGAPFRRIWQRTVNRSDINDWLNWYFLAFADRSQRIAFAPSLCYDELSKWQMGLLARGVENFDRVSVREAQGADFIRRCSGIEATVLCDPTLALMRDEWISTEDGRLTPEDPYILAYILGNPTEEHNRILGQVSRYGRIPVVSLSDKSLMGEPEAGPSEFVSLIANAEHVVTDSFHASVFASIFECPLTIVRRQGVPPMFARLENLSKALGIQNKIYDGGKFDLALHSDFEGVSDAIARERGLFLAFLVECING